MKSEKFLCRSVCLEESPRAPTVEVGFGGSVAVIEAGIGAEGAAGGGIGGVFTD